MKTTTNTSVTSTLGGEFYAMQFDVDGAAHLMGILSNMYSDAPLAVLREYAANAWDAHVMAGQTRPIEVTLPTQWDKNLIIQDWGIGLSKDEIIKVYATYGKSTKRDSNSQIGAFGIGAKSAFTVGPQFVVTAVKDNFKTIALFSIGSNGAPGTSILSNEPTDEPNGVTVSIAISEKYDIFRTTAERLFSTWKPGTVLVNGEQPVSVYDDMMKITDDIHIKQNVWGSGGITLVMGGIGYPASNSMVYAVKSMLSDANKETSDLLYNRRFSLIANVPVGSVDITPSREDLRDTPRTLETIKNVIIDHDANLARIVGEMIDDAYNGMEASEIIKANEFFVRRANTTIEWNGTPLSYKVEVKQPTIVFGDGANSKRVTYVNDQTEVYLGKTNFSTIHAVVGVGKELVGSVRHSSKRYMEYFGVDRIIVIPNNYLVAEWFNIGRTNHIKTMTLDEYKAELKNIPSNSSASEITYYTNIPGTYGCTVKRIKSEGKPIFYTNRYHSSTTDSTFEHLFKDAIVIRLSGRQTPEALVKRIPEAKSATDAIKAYAESVVKNITDAELDALYFSKDRHCNFFTAINDRIGQNAFGDFVDEYSTMAGIVESMTTTDRALKIKCLGFLNNPRKAKKHDYTFDVEKALKEYPLLKDIYLGYSSNPQLPSEKLLTHACAYVKAMLELSAAETTDPEEETV